jgi:hypothetical protein
MSPSVVQIIRRIRLLSLEIFAENSEEMTMFLETSQSILSKILKLEAGDQIFNLDSANTFSKQRILIFTQKYHQFCHIFVFAYLWNTLSFLRSIY